MELRKQLRWLLVIAAVFPLIVIGIVVVCIDYQRHRDSIYSKLELDVVRKSNVASRYMNDINQLADIFTHIPCIDTAMRNYDINTTLSKENCIALQKFLRYSTDTKPSVNLISIFDPNGMCIISSDTSFEKQPVTNRSADIVQEEMKIAAEKGVFFSEIVSSPLIAKGKRAFYCLKPIYGDNRHPIGYICFHLSMELLMEMVTLGDPPQDNITFTAIYDQTDHFINSKPPHTLLFAGNEGGMVGFYSIWKNIDFVANPSGLFPFYNATTGARRIVYYSVIDGTNWKIVRSTSFKAVITPVIINICVLLGFIILTGALFLYIATRYANIMTRRMDKVIKQLEFVRPLKKIEARTKTYEIDKMINAFNSLLEMLEGQTKELRNRAKYDQLTKLYNRPSFEEAVRHLIKNYNPETDVAKSYLVFLFVDIDDFKNFNSMYGHAFGDRVIRFIGEILLNAIHGHGYGCRFGGDEFVLCLNDPAIINDLPDFLHILTKRLSSELVVRDGDVLQIKCSIGITRFPENGTAYETLIQKADEAMYSIKLSGKNGIKESDI